MKKTFLLLFVWALCVVSAAAQEKPAPRSEFAIELSTSSLEIKTGESRDVTVHLNRSKSYSKSKGVLGLSSGLPEGITVSFEPATDVTTEGIAKIAVAKTAKPGSYMIILNGTLEHKTKGATLTLTVREGEPSTAVSSIH
ncbi:hypothetical protein SAMN04488109_3712 [Chryseolinea serpens]|uniref:Uncharacterized protein n=1 Tax=Chryseolinea serpens TaxID=947013 RepID=A0A1M5S3W5_9BACT|nr:hypothetical protein [Chryseolinea serpens]SHH32643.1 hypothetical protein SAMN04488109_3712 [Chryseolinea serpens]